VLCAVKEGGHESALCLTEMASMFAIYSEEVLQHLSVDLENEREIGQAREFLIWFERWASGLPEIIHGIVAAE
jgi:hypothetical protein